jgi:N-acetylmuramoyl-L-alanine amidase
VVDLQRRLRSAGFPVRDDADGVFGSATTVALTAFQASRGLAQHEECDEATWSVLVESGYQLGDRLLCLRSPMLRGEDVSDLQLRLGALGFDAGRVDGIFGPRTQHAVAEFQRNAGLVTDEVCGPDTVEALIRLEGRGGSAPVTAVRERDQLRRNVGGLDGRRLAVGAASLDHPLPGRLGGALQRTGAAVVLVDGAWSDQAERVNAYGADVFVAIELVDTPVADVAYFAVPGYESVGGRQLAEAVLRELPASPGWAIGTVRGMRTPALRESRPPAVVLRLGDHEQVSAQVDLVVAAVVRALASWADDPC